jgi:bacterioferritin-associated ferredoxin
MFVCLCTGVTSQVVSELVAAGASTSKQIADACGAGADCGRCRRTVRAIIEASTVGECPRRAALSCRQHASAAPAAPGLAASSGSRT